ncbi:hypothetical protein Tco_1482784 [Tanacetum coccineum]
MTESPLMDSSFAVLVFSLGDDLIACLHKAMAFLTAVASSRFPSTNNQLRTSSNPRNQATIQDGKYMLWSDKHVAMPVIDDEETLILEEKSQSKMSEKAKDPEIIDKNISHKPIDYEKLNRLSEDFGKRFTLQQEMDAEQAFWLRISNPFPLNLLMYPLSK